MTTLEIFKKAKKHISDPAMWYQGGYTEEMGVQKNRVPRDDEPCCAIGAIYWASGSHQSFWHLALGQHTGDMSVADFNDDPSITHADIMALFDRAIAAEEARQ